jgi:YfiH family protein
MNVLDTALVPPHATAGVFNRAAVSHGFFGRRGGVSDGYYDSLNTAFGPDDDAEAGAARDRMENILENRDRIARAVGLETGADIASLRQVHGARVFSVARRAWSRAARPEGDAMVTDRPGVGLGILTADCAPVLFHAPGGSHGVIGAAHVGRRGALGGILGATVQAMTELGAKTDEITAVIGPAIGQASYPLPSADGREIFMNNPSAGEYLTPEQGGYTHFDLQGYCALRLRDAGVRHVHIIRHDTASMPGEYFSYRRSLKAGEPARGLQMSVIALHP